MSNNRGGSVVTKCDVLQALTRDSLLEFARRSMVAGATAAHEDNAVKSLHTSHSLMVQDLLDQFDTRKIEATPPASHPQRQDRVRQLLSGQCLA